VKKGIKWGSYLWSSYQFITHDTDLLCYSLSHMLQVTEKMLVLAKQPQKLLNEYDVPAEKVADMIREATTEITKNVNDNLNGHQNKKSDMGDLSKTPLFFAARRHRYKKNIYVVRIQEPVPKFRSQLQA
jgi:hypothetical protein